MQATPVSLKINPPFRADHVGSFLRSESVKRARAQQAAGEITADELRRIEDEAIVQLIAKQEEVGIRGITDGECRRATYLYDFLVGLDGIEHQKIIELPWSGGIAKLPMCHVVDKISHGKPIQVDDFNFVKQHISKPDCFGKVCIPSPGTVHFYFEGVTKAYPDEKEFFDDIVKAYRAEIDALYKAGCRYLQLDETNLAVICDPKKREIFAQKGLDVDTLPQKYIELINRSIEGRPSDLAVSVHLCKGNYRSQWFAEGGYDYVAKTLFTTLNVDAFFLEWDDERSGDFQPLRHVPPGKLVVLGIVCSKVAQLEKKEELIARIHEAAKYCPLEQLAISPQCGFASSHEGNALTEEEQWAKMRLCVEVAKEIWGDN